MMQVSARGANPARTASFCEAGCPEVVSHCGQRPLRQAVLAHPCNGFSDLPPELHQKNILCMLIETWFQPIPAARLRAGGSFL